MSTTDLAIENPPTLGELGGHVTCSRLECPNPCAADQLLHGEPGPAATQATEPAGLRDLSIPHEPGPSRPPAT